MITGPGYTLHLGDAATVLRTLPKASVQTVVTSPPYFGQRDYGTGTWSGGDAACDHVKIRTNYNANFNARWGNGEGGNRKQEAASRPVRYSRVCARCGATRENDGQIGLEDTPQSYVEALVAVFGEAKRVLRRDGTLWIVIGDCYARNSHGRAGATSELAGRRRAEARCYPAGVSTRGRGVRCKSLFGMPWRLALALIDDGWILRQEVIWAKPSCLPESVKDRPTRSHEQVFLFSRSENYYWDHAAAQEPAVGEPNRMRTRIRGEHEGDPKGSFPWAGSETRNIRSVWRISTVPYDGDHFAVFPPELPERCLLLSSRPGDTVLDPFAGTATTGSVAVKHGRSFVGIEISADYTKLAAERLAQGELFAGGTHGEARP